MTRMRRFRAFRRPRSNRRVGPRAEIRSCASRNERLRSLQNGNRMPASSSTALRLRCGVSSTVQRSYFRFEPAFREGGRAVDPNDRSQREQAEQPNAGLEHPGRLPFQLHPDRKRSCNLLIAIELQCSFGRVVPFSLAKIDFDVITDIAAKREIDIKSRVFHAESTDDRPRISHMIRNFVRLAGTPENSKRKTTRRSGNAFTSTRRRNPQISRAGSRSERLIRSWV